VKSDKITGSARVAVGVRMVVLTGLLVGVVAALSACSPGYVIRAAYEQSKILVNRRPIDEVLRDPSTSAEDKEKLALVLEARRFAQGIGLDPKGSFTSFSDVGKDSLAWIVVGARKDSFALHTWWFPIVGEVPYKGFFEKSDADQQGRELEALGYEASIRDTDAFSTLGWFNDPLLSTTLKSSPTRIANTVIHESVHSTVWIKNNVAFNESLAHFVGTQAALEFFGQRAELCHQLQEGCKVAGNRVRVAALDQERQLELARVLAVLYRALDTLYKDPTLTSEQKVQRRGEVFKDIVAPLHVKYPTLQILKSVHNAEIMQLMLYNTELDSFARLFEKTSGTWAGFWAAIRSIQEAVARDEHTDPFSQLNSLITEENRGEKS
jgi:predicted aminopeptidase